MTDLLVEQRGPIRVLTNNDAPRNRMSLAFMDELEAQVDEITADDATRAVVITGAGDEHFSVGMNLKEMMGDTSSRGGMEGVLDQRLRVLSAIETMGKPWVATLYGYCLGGGLELPLACHFRIAADEGAQIGLPEADLGTVPAWGGSARLTKRVGVARSLDMILRGRKITGTEAYEYGIVTELVPVSGIKERAIELAEELASMPRMAVKTMMESIVGSEERSLADMIKAEREAVRACSNTPDLREGMMAFLEKRDPVFNQRS